jgi:hypothetical protein
MARLRRARARRSYRSSRSSCSRQLRRLCIPCFGMGRDTSGPRVGDSSVICSRSRTRAARTRLNATSHSAMTRARSRSTGTPSPPKMAVASWSTSAGIKGSSMIRAARPWRRALRRTRIFADAVRGPVLRCALRRLAAILASDVTATRTYAADFFARNRPSIIAADGLTGCRATCSR